MAKIIKGLLEVGGFAKTAGDGGTFTPSTAAAARAVIGAETMRGGFTDACSHCDPLNPLLFSNIILLRLSASTDEQRNDLKLAILLGPVKCRVTAMVPHVLVGTMI